MYKLPGWLLEPDFVQEPHYLEPYFQVYIEDGMWFYIMTKFGFGKVILIRKPLMKALK